MSYRASCPQCGDQVEFRLDRSLLSVCGSCGSAIARKGADLESYGKVADLIPTASLLNLGIDGRDPGSGRTFTLVGRLQLDHGAGTWDEWLLGYPDGSSAWLSESQGKFHLMHEAAMPPLPNLEQLALGDAVDLGPAGSFVVAEIKRATFKTAAGELPFDARPGTVLNYADLSGPTGQFATIDYGDGSEPLAVYVGQEMPLDDLGFAQADLKSAEERHGAAKGAAVSCTQCGGPLEIRAPDHTKRDACSYCGSMLDATTGRYEILQAASKVKLKPLIELGSSGRLGGVKWTVLGCMERSVTVEGIRYPWREYLLYEQSKGFRWLLENNGHWTFVEPLPTGALKRWRARSGMPRATVHHDGERYKHFQTGFGQVDQVLGEFYWTVSQGDRTDMHDYVAPPYVMSVEVTRDELQFSRGTYLEPDEVWKAFRLKGEPPEPLGVAPNQPWPHKATCKSVNHTFWLVFALLWLVFLGFSILGGKKVYSHTVAIPEVEGTGKGDEQVVFQSPPFEIARSGNLKVAVNARLANNSWLYLSGALIEQKSGRVQTFDLEPSYYSGSGWRENKSVKSRFLSGVSPGTYRLTLAPQWKQGLRPRSYTLEARHGVPRFRYLLMALVLVSLVPLVYVMKRLNFEQRRWAESDHPWGESS